MRRGNHSIYVVAVLVTFIAVLLIGVSFLYTMSDVMRTTEQSTRCSGQIRAHTAAVQLTNDLKTPKIVCPTERLSPSPREAKRTLAEAMVSCWDMWGRGRLRLFGEGEGAYCHVCSVTYLPEPVREFPQYLNEERMRFLGPTYAEYLMGEKQGTYYENELPKAGPSELPDDVPIGVFFYYAKGQTWTERALNGLIGNPTRNTVVGGVVGGATAIALVASVPVGGIGAAVVLGTLGTVAGAGTGLLSGIFGREPLDTMAYVSLRPLTEEDIKLLGCTYAPVSDN